MPSTPTSSSTSRSGLGNGESISQLFDDLNGTEPRTSEAAVRPGSRLVYRNRKYAFVRDAATRNRSTAQSQIALLGRSKSFEKRSGSSDLHTRARKQPQHLASAGRRSIDASFRSSRRSRYPGERG